MKKYFLLSSIFLLLDLIIKMLLRTDSVLESIEFGIMCVQEKQNLTIGHRFFSICLIMLIVLVAESSEAKQKKLKNMIIPRVNHLAKPKCYMIWSTVKMALLFSISKLTVDTVLCVIFKETVQLVSVFRISILFFLFSTEMFLANSVICKCNVNPQIAMLIFLLFSIFVPDISKANNLFFAIFCIAVPSYQENFIIIIVVKLIFVSILSKIYLKTHFKKDAL